MKKFLLGLMAFLGMALCFTACGDDDNDDSKSAAETSGTALYEGVKDYQAATDDVSKIAAAAKIFGSYNDYKQNKDQEGWIKEFATGAVSSLANEKKEDAKTKLVETLSQSENVTNSIQGVANLASALNTIFNS